MLDAADMDMNNVLPTFKSFNDLEEGKVEKKKKTGTRIGVCVDGGGCSINVSFCLGRKDVTEKPSSLVSRYQAVVDPAVERQRQGVSVIYCHRPWCITNCANSGGNQQAFI